MTKLNRLTTAVVAAGVLTLAACGTMQQPTQAGSVYSAPPAGQVTPTAYSGTGTLQSIELVQEGTTDGGIGVGAVGGAVVGGLAGSQIGAGTGRTAATVLGAAGGAAAGHALEKGQRPQQQALYRFNVRMDDGNHQSLVQPMDSDFRVGDRVRIENGVLRRL
jgi:outer membrane lipoprotein SlyB